jgi:hypothetical protein
MPPIRAATVPLLLALVLCACDRSDDRLRQQMKQDVATNLSGREDVSPADRAAAAEAIAEDAVQLRRDADALRREAAATDEGPAPPPPSPTELAARDCEQQRLELEALRRLESDPGALDEAQRQALPAEIRRAEAVRAERCPEQR